MDDLRLDDLLRQAAPAPPVGAAATAVLLARQLRDEQAGAVALRGRRHPRRITVAAVVAALSLSGAGTLTAYQLGVPPFQSLESGVMRAMTGVPVDYTSSTGQDVECLAFIEYRNLDAHQRDRIESAAGDDRWNGYGQRVLDGLAIPTASPEDQQLAIGRVVGEDLWLAARAAVPGLVHAQTGRTDGPLFTGSSMSCDIVGDRG